MEDASLSRVNAAHTARLTKTIKELQARVEEQEAALDKVWLPVVFDLSKRYL